MLRFRPFHHNFFFHPNRHLALFCTHPFNYILLFPFSLVIIIIVIIIIIIIIITLFKSQVILAKHKCTTNWGDCKSNKSNQINQIKSNQMLVFEERGKPE